MTFFIVGMVCFFAGWFMGVEVYKRAFNEALRKNTPEEVPPTKPSAVTTRKTETLKKCPVEHCRISTPHSHAQAFLDRLKDSKPQK